LYTKTQKPLKTGEKTYNLKTFKSFLKSKNLKTFAKNLGFSSPGEK